MPIDYDVEEGPKLSIRVQELFGLDRHPAIAGGRAPLPLAQSPRDEGLQRILEFIGGRSTSTAGWTSPIRGRIRPC
jgi:ATP-dependent helicase HrpB